MGAEGSEGGPSSDGGQARRKEGPGVQVTPSGHD